MDKSHPVLLTLARLAAATALFAALGVAAGCSRPAAGEPVASVEAKEFREVRITGDDSMLFSELTIAARPGEALRVVFSNTGTRPKESMGHNWVLLRPTTEAQVNEFGLAAAAAAPDYIPRERRKQILAATKMLGPGESDAVAFIVPSQPGEYPYICTFPGHFTLMKGWLVVK